MQCHHVRNCPIRFPWSCGRARDCSKRKQMMARFQDLQAAALLLRRLQAAALPIQLQQPCQPRTISTTLPAATLPAPAAVTATLPAPTAVTATLPAVPATKETDSKSKMRDEPVNVLKDIPIKVFHPEKKRDSKTFMLRLQIDEISNLNLLREEILEQLGKKLIKFDLKFDIGYFAGSQKICFSENDDMKKELARIDKKGKSLWYNGLKKTVEGDVTICVDDSDFSDNEQQPAKKPKLNALESKAQ